METPPPTHEPAPRRRIPLIAVGGLIALLAGLGIAGLLVANSAGGPGQPAPASQAGLVIDTAPTEEATIDPAKPLRCFVSGQFVGELSLTACAQRNGVATDALDVGLDQTGALAAAPQAGETLIPLPPAEEAPPAAAEPPPQLEEGGAGLAEVSAAGPCWRHGGGRWRKLAADMDLNACVQTLFAGRCEKPGGATYGRWGRETLRRVQGRVEVSDDNKTFRPLAAQASDCSLPAVG